MSVELKQSIHRVGIRTCRSPHSLHKYLGANSRLLPESVLNRCIKKTSLNPGLSRFPHSTHSLGRFVSRTIATSWVIFSISIAFHMGG